MTSSKQAKHAFTFTSSLHSLRSTMELMLLPKRYIQDDDLRHYSGEAIYVY